jgi:hypothetical protein
MNEPKLDDITLRDLFAMFALAGTAAKSNYYEQQARVAYALADAMLEARKQNENR